MRVVHDAGAMPFDQWVMLAFPLAGIALTLWLWKTAERRLWWKLAAGFALFLGLLTVALPYADHDRVQARAIAGEVTTVEGPINGHRRWTERSFAGSSRGVGVTNFDRYNKTTYEYFYIGDTPFTFIVGGYPSHASFTNAADPPVAIADGMWARAKFFRDDWYNDERRITRLELAPAPPAGARPLSPVSVPQAPPAKAGSNLPPDFAAFWEGFAAAVGRGNAAAVRPLVAFPFHFDSHELDADEFDSLWMSLFAAPLRPCIAAAAPVREGDRYVIFCAGYGYYFAKTASGWKLAEFLADGEAMQ
ncbi:hypothetical protein CV103_06165 [Sphingomonas fennica]|uniref:Uncharacterized protein n=1 Tax=Edaphosphingomonas fennica TaxID=114404 RepID=A0A2T4I587_9SPHN|nr:hypothetical protein CV103_06165 [Sphingomonas fennica]